ncbi:hypothetical protein [Streptomyces sp. NPDC018000]
MTTTATPRTLQVKGKMTADAESAPALRGAHRRPRPAPPAGGGAAAL